MIDELKTDYKDDVLATSQQGKRTFNIVGKNGEILFEDVHIEDISRYLQVGDEYGQEIINEQNSAINQLSKGTGYVFDTYAEYLEAYQGGEIPVGAIVYIKEGSVDGTITALQVKYNDSNVKLALDTLGTRIDGKQDKLTNPLTQADVKNNLTSTDTNKPLSAKQGKELNNKNSPLIISNQYNNFIDVINAVRTTKSYPISIQKNGNSSYSNLPNGTGTYEWNAVLYGDAGRTSILFNAYIDNSIVAIGSWFNGWTSIGWRTI